MNRKQQREALRRAFAAPQPQRRDAFLRRVAPLPPCMSAGAFLLTQAGYLHWGVWAASALVFGAAVLCGRALGPELLPHLSALTPLLALTLVAESSRSVRCGMAELELATRFSLRRVTLARMGLLGIENLALLCLLVPLAARQSARGVLAVGSYLLAPYLLTVCVGLALEQRLRGPEGMYACCAAGAAISVTIELAKSLEPLLYAPPALGGWAMGTALLLAATAVQAHRMLKQTEEITWN